jgi:hypothetical protein
VRRFPISLAAAGLASLLMILGGFGPWAKANVLLGGTTIFSLTINGTDGGGDGWIVIVAAGVAIALLVVIAFTWQRWLALIPLIAGVVGAAVAGYDVSDINTISADSGRATANASAEWGIYLSLVASIALALASVAMLYELKRRRPASDALAVLPPAPEIEDRPHEQRAATAESRDPDDREQPSARPEA